MTRQNRYFSFSAFLRDRYGCPVRKVTIDAGFSCPNRDGTLGTSGCVYCANRSFSPNSRLAERPSVREQMESGIRRIEIQHPRARFIAYFQAFTNTYAPPEHLRKIYAQALHPKVIALAIGTRPDCVSEAVLDVIEESAGDREVWMEYGLQSANDKTLARIQRGHDVAAFVNAVQRTKERGFLICAHVILGLPGESKEDMLRTAAFLSEQQVDAVKIHHLHVVRGTPLAEMHARGEVPVLEVDEYVRLVADFLEHLSPGILIQRLAGDAPREYLIAPIWKDSKGRIIQRIEMELEKRGTQQGSCVKAGRKVAF